MKGRRGFALTVLGALLPCHGSYVDTVDYSTMDPGAAWMARLAARPIPDPSPRTPHRSTYSNDADNIEREMQKWGHRLWGFVIYRTTYDSEEDWNRFMDRLSFRTRELLEFHGGLDISGSNPLTIFNDRALFDGATTSAIRLHFVHWANTAPEREQGSTAHHVFAARYNFCIQVDDASLKSVLHNAQPLEDPDPYTKGFVNLIRKDWEPYEVHHPSEAEYPSLEGCTLEKVGWLRVGYSDAMVAIYQRLRMPHDWYLLERIAGRPPGIGYV